MTLSYCSHLLFILCKYITRARICKHLRSPGIESLESIPGLLKRLQIRSQDPSYRGSHRKASDRSLTVQFCFKEFYHVHALAILAALYAVQRKSHECLDSYFSGMPTCY